MIVIGALGGVGHFLFVLAYERAPASLLAPLAYLQLILAVLFGQLAFGETPGLFTIVGGVVITAGGLLVISDRRDRDRPPGAERANAAAASPQARPSILGGG